MEIPWFDINNSKSLFCKITISDAVATSDLAISDTAFQRQVLWSLVTLVEANFAKCLTDFFEKLHLPLYKSRLLEGTVLQGQRMTFIRTTRQKIILERQYIFKITKKNNSKKSGECFIERLQSS